MQNDIPSDEYPADATTAGVLSPDSPVSGSIQIPGDVDWLRVTLQAGELYRFDLEGAENGQNALKDPAIAGLYDAAGNPIADTGNDDAVGLNARIDYSPDISGEYYLAVAGLEDSAGNYRASATKLDMQNALQRYRFDFLYGNGDSYKGYGYAEKGAYSVGQSWTALDENGQTGVYTVTGTSLASVDTYGANPGAVYVDAYYDVETGQTLKAFGFGAEGPGSERGILLSDDESSAFGRDPSGGAPLEADIDSAKAAQIYKFVFSYGNGDAYEGFGYAELGAYASRQSWTAIDENGQTGTYSILGTETVAYTPPGPATDFWPRMPEKGQVYVLRYFDAETGQDYVPQPANEDAAKPSGAFGGDGLGSERGYIFEDPEQGAFGRNPAGGSRLEADIDANKAAQLYSFKFTYGNGDFYSGYGFADRGAYTLGQSWNAADENGQTGTYSIVEIADLQPGAQDKNKVTVYYYYDAETQASYYPQSASGDYWFGFDGLGSERGFVFADAELGAFGRDANGGPRLEADIDLNDAVRPCSFKFAYGNGDSYSGTVFAAPGAYSSGQTWTVTDENGSVGTYVIDWVGDLQHGTEDLDKVEIYSYFDAETQSDYYPQPVNGDGRFGLDGLGSERGIVLGDEELGAFGRNAAGGAWLEADIDLSKVLQVYKFEFTYGNGDFYAGYGYADRDAYTHEQSWSAIDENGQIGTYAVYLGGFASAAEGFAGQVFVSEYYDSEFGRFVFPDSKGEPNGVAGLGSESGTISGDKTLGAFGKDPEGGAALEADFDLSAELLPPPFPVLYLAYEGQARIDIAADTSAGKGGGGPEPADPPPVVAYDFLGDVGGGEVTVFGGLAYPLFLAPHYAGEIVPFVSYGAGGEWAVPTLEPITLLAVGDPAS